MLISRRGCERQGTRHVSTSILIATWSHRFNVRGADEKGNVANYVETEQIAVFPVKSDVF